MSPLESPGDFYLFIKILIKMEKRNTEIVNWVKSNCEPKAIPLFLLKEGLRDGNLSYADIVAEINLQAKETAMLFIDKDKEIQNFLNLLESAPFKKEGRVAQGGVCYLNLSHFILSDNLIKLLLQEYKLIKTDVRRLTALAVIIEKNFPEIWHYNPGGTNNDMVFIEGLRAAATRFKQFLMLMNPKVEDIEERPNKDSTGAYSYYFFNRAFAWSKFSIGEYCFDPMYELEEKFKGNDYVHFRYGNGPGTMKETFSFEVLVAYGLEQAEIIYKNLLSSYELINESSAEGFKQRILNRFCHNRFVEVKNNSEIISAINRITEGKDYTRLLDYDFDVDHGIIVYIDGRSEYGHSGGVGQKSQVIVLYNGQEVMKEFTYRDRYSGSNDNYAYDFGSVKIIEVKEDNGYLNIVVEAKPNEKRFSSTNINFHITSEKAKRAPLLSESEQISFTSFFQKSKKDKLSELKERHSHRTGLHMSKDYSGEVLYPAPRISTEMVKTEIGVGVFVTQECIDHMVTVLQWRYVLYLVKNQEVVEIFRDNSYENGGDASICGLEFFSNKLQYTTREGRKEYRIY